MRSQLELLRSLLKFAALTPKTTNAVETRFCAREGRRSDADVQARVQRSQFDTRLFLTALGDRDPVSISMKPSVPLARTDSREIARSVPAQFSGHVLLVEDNAVSAMIAKAELQKLGVSVIHALDGIHALSVFETRPFDLVLMDCELPFMDGYEATKGIRQIEQSEGRLRTPVVAFTAHALSGDRETCLAKGMDDYLSKPVVQDALERILEKFLPAKASSKTV